MSEVHPHSTESAASIGGGHQPKSPEGTREQSRATVAKSQTKGLAHDEQVAALAVPSGPGWPSPGTSVQLTSRDRSEPDPMIGEARERADALLEKITTAVGKYTEAIVDWQSEGWREFLRGTGGNGFIGLTSAEWAGLNQGLLNLPSDLGFGAGSRTGGPAARADGPARAIAQEPPIAGVNDAVGNAALAMGIEAGGAGALKAMAKSAGGQGAEVIQGLLVPALSGMGLPGLVVDVLVNLIWSAVSSLLGLDRSADTRADKAAERATDQAFSVANAIRASATESTSRWESKKAEFKATMASDAIGRVELESLIELLQSNLAALGPPRPAATELTARLRDAWLRQHAGDEEDANAETNTVSYERTRRQARADPEFVGEKGLFIDQCKNAWGLLGVGLDGPVATLNAVLGATKRSDASTIAGKLSGTRIDLSNIQSPQLFEANLPIPGGMPLREKVTEDLAAAATQRTFDFWCTLDLTDEDGSVFVNRFEYELVPKPGANAHRVARSGAVPQQGQIAPRSWTKSPD